MRGCVSAVCPTPQGKEKFSFLGEHPQAPGPSTSSGQAGWLRPLHPLPESQLCTRTINRLPGFPIYESVINFVGGVPVAIPLPEDTGFQFDLDLFERGGRKAGEVAGLPLNGAGVGVLSGSAFGECGEGYLRLSYANTEANLRLALDRMRPVFERLDG